MVLGRAHYNDFEDLIQSSPRKGSSPSTSLGRLDHFSLPAAFESLFLLLSYTAAHESPRCNSTRLSKRFDRATHSPLCSANLTSLPSLDSSEHLYAHTAAYTRFTPCAVAALPFPSLLSRWQPPFLPLPRSRLLLLDPGIPTASEAIASQNGISILLG